MEVTTCTICNNISGNRAYHFKDYHLRTEKEYEYFKCAQCGCLQKTRTEEDHAQYYPDNYYSYTKDDRSSIISKIKWGLRDIRNSYYRTGRGFTGKIIHSLLPCMSVAMVEKANPQKSWRVLDVGCGSDALMLQYLSQRGFVNLFGVDPFIKQDITIGNATILRKSLEDCTDTFHLITLNHSFEHMRNQESILLHCKKILNPDGVIILRIPVVSSFAWEQYKEFWPKLDAPRHLYLHSIESIQYLVQKCGLLVKNCVYDSTAFQFWGAELYKKGYALHQKTFLFKQIKFAYRIYYSILKRKTVEQLNNDKKGDTIALFLKHI
jgi:SAM-dependent methyltransferase